MASRKSYSNIKKDEHVVFFRTNAHLSDDHAHWIIPIHGWIYEPENSRFRKKLVSSIFEKKYELKVTSENDSVFSERLNLLIADNERGKRILIRLGKHTKVLPKSRPNGHFRGEMKIPVDEAEELAVNGLLQYEAIVSPKEDRRFCGQCLLKLDRGVSIISDIDDTVKVTQVRERRKLIEHTFFKRFSAVEGMATLYRDFEKSGATLQFVSSSPWQLYKPLLDFLAANNFPWAPLQLKSVRFRDETLFNLFKKGTTTKPAQIEPILKAYPKRKFILIGDSGEQDPEVYGEIARRYPENITNILIRNISGETFENDRFKAATAGTPTSIWSLFDNPASIKTEELLGAVC
ncbi:MAG: phosphatase domain-containing protein [Verrucomicrobiota bacterium]